MHYTLAGYIVTSVNGITGPESQATSTGRNPTMMTLIDNAGTTTLDGQAEDTYIGNITGNPSEYTIHDLGRGNGKDWFRVQGPNGSDRSIGLLPYSEHAKQLAELVTPSGGALRNARAFAARNPDSVDDHSDADPGL